MKIAIAGYGVEGQENLAYWSQDPENDIMIVDERADGGATYPHGVDTMLGPGVFKNLNGFDLVVRTAGLAPYKIETDGKIWSATNEFFAKCPAPIIGVTGSKGKGTTSSLIASILEAAGKKVWLVGNIGVPALGVLSQVQPEDVVVYELSSFQLWDLEKSPHVAVVLHIEADHLDVHRSMDEYVEAKGQITRWQTEDDILVYNANNTYAERIAATSQAQKIPYPSASAAYVHMYDEMFCYGEYNALCSIHELRIPGGHNVVNALAAIDAVWPFTQDPAAIKAGFNAFHGLPHRLAYVATVDGVEYYDDSIATTPGSAIAALNAFPGKQKVIILGGSYKGSDFSELAHELTQHQVKALLIGDEAQRISQACEDAGFRNYEIIDDVPASTIAETVTRRAAEFAQPGSVVLLSPSAASFGLFKNYVDRGEQFIAAVKGLEN